MPLEISGITKNLTEHSLAFVTSALQRLGVVDPQESHSYWRSVVLEKRKRECFIYSASFDPSTYSAHFEESTQPLLSNKAGLSLVVMILGWMKCGKNTTFSCIKGKTKKMVLKVVV